MANVRKARNRYRIKKTNKSLSARLSVHRTARHIYAQVIDDTKGITVAAYSTKAKGFEGKTSGVPAAEKVGEAVAKLAIKAKVETVVFDRGEYNYHGRVKALAEGARKAGLKF